MQCDGVGRIGDRCTTTLCERSRYAYIPVEPYKRIKDRPGAFRDSLVGRELDDYVLVDHLGTGGFSRVYLALQRPLLMKTALKVMAPIRKNRVFDEDELFEHLEREASALARISHPNIVRLIQFADYGDPPYLVMEYVSDGRTLQAELADLVKWNQEMDTEAAWHILSQVLNGIEAAHEEGVLHLDLSPQNIMLQTVKGDHRFVRVFDFGLGRVFGDEAGDEAGDNDRVMGTPEYLAPEALVGGELGAGTDVFALGVLAFTLLNWKSPYFGLDRDEIMAAKRDPSYKPDAVLPRDSLSPSALRVYRKSMANDPSERYATIAAFRLDLRRVLSDTRDRSD